MSILGEAVLTVAVEFLIKKLASSELLSFARQERIQADLKKWENMLLKIYAVLEDAEEKQMTNQFVKRWLVDLKNLAYDIEDILDEFATIALERKLSHGSESSTSTMVRKLIPIKFNPHAVKFNFKMGSEMKKITGRLQEIAAQKNNLDLREGSEIRSNKVRDTRLPTTSLSEAHVYGREKDEAAIIELLLKDEGNEDGISIIPIVGIGGVGKTTLAQNVYNNLKVKSHFDLKAWACVSDDFDVIKVTKAILHFIAPESHDSSDLNKLQVELKENLLGKKFLIVLDDIWNENPNKWKTLLRPFESNFPGGKIIVTTRSNYISSMVSTCPAYPLEVLSDDDCLSIFAHHSMGREGFNGHPEYLREIAEKIVERCRGLPLAAKTLGGLLHNNINRNDWEHVLNSEIWNLPTDRSDIMPALWLSYHYLPPHLKPCFAYCSLLPKDYEFQKDEIILLWMAQGFLQPEGGTGEQMEDLGDNFFRELQSRSFFQQSSNDNSRYVMHDLINDLAQWVAGEIFYYRMKNTVKSDNQNNISKNLRHLSYVGGWSDGIKKFETFYGVDNTNNLTYNGGLYDGAQMFKPFNDLKHLRTFLPLMLPLCDTCCLTSDILNILPKVRSLRILSLNGYSITKLSDSIGDLIHLRFLDLSYTTIDVLPKSVSRLYNLQTLKLKCCQHLKKLCEEMGNLINLRYLDLSKTYYLEDMASKVGKLTSLRTLSDFVVSKSRDCGLKELKLLKHLRGTLNISGLENVNDAVDAKEANLSGKMNLTVLSLNWNNCESRNQRIEAEVLSMLQPCNSKLEELTIWGYGGNIFPTWLGNTSFSNLVVLTFAYCSNCTSLPSVGQLPSLKQLYIQKMSAIKRVGQEFYGHSCSRPFPKLECLSIREMEEWEDWEDWISHGFSQEVEEFPRLQKLFIEQCPKLQGRLPKHLPLLKRLHVYKCKQLLVSVPSLPADCSIEIAGCKQVEHRNMVSLSSLNSQGFSDIASQGLLIDRQRLSETEKVEIIGYEELHRLTSFLHTGITSQQDGNVLRYLLDSHPIGIIGYYFTLMEEKEEQLQQQESAWRCRYLILENCVCIAKLPQALHNFSSLQRLRLSKSPELVSIPEAGLPSQLRSIEIVSCNALESLPDSWMDSTSLEYLSLERCESLTYLARNQLPPNLKQLEIECCYNLQTLMQDDNNNLQSSTSGIAVCPSPASSLIKKELPATLEHIKIFYCFNLRSLSSSGNLPAALKHLHLCYLNIESVAKTFHNNACLKIIDIRRCDRLKFLPEDLQKLSHLQVISIGFCPSLVPFPIGRFHKEECEKPEALTDNMLPLNHLQVSRSDCSSLVSFPERGLPSANLTQLMISIYGCSSLVSCPDGGLCLMNLTELKIGKCKKLEALPSCMQQFNHLRKIELFDCSSLVSFPGRGLPSTNLTELQIVDCEKLEVLPSCMHQLNHLQKLEILRCSGLVSFPVRGLPSMSLTELIVKNCEKLEVLPNNMHNLTSLRELTIEDCPGIKSSSPEYDFPTNLTSLVIRNLKIFKPLSEWGLQRLTSLAELQIKGCPDVVSFPPTEIEIMLQTSLIFLEIEGFPNLKHLSSAIRNLSSLESLYLINCPKLESFPKKGLPVSLLDLCIDQCPLLEQKCKNSSGKYWPLIAHIPHIGI